MKPSIKGILSRHVFAQAACKGLIGLTCLALPSLIQAQTLQHKWSFNEPSGSTTATDSVAGANITLLGSTSLGGGVLTLPGGGGNYAQFPNGILSTNNSITIETWLTDNAGLTWARSWSFGGETTGPNNSFIQNNYIDLIPHDGGGVMETEFNHSGNVDATSGAALPTGTEEYTVVTYDSPSQTVRLYLNGVQVAIATGVTITPASLGYTYNNFIGLDQWNDPVFNGTFDEMRIWTAPVTQRYISASAVAGPNVVINNLNPTSASLTVATNMNITGTQVPLFTVQLPQTGANNLLATADATNWVSSNPNVLSVNSSGLITAVGVGSAIVSAKVAGVGATSATIFVTPQTLLHRYSFVSDASDSVGGANGTIVAPGNANGTNAVISNGLVLSGGGGNDYSGYLALPPGLLTNTTSLTVETWVTQNTPNGWATVWDFAVNNNQNFELCPNPQRGINNLDVAVEPNGGEIDDVTSSFFPSGSEQYVAYTFNASTLVGDIFTNGVLNAVQTYPNTTYVPGSIGGAAGTSDDWLGNDVFGDSQFQGTIYEFRIWNGAVSPAYLAASAVAGPSVVITNVTPTSLAVSLTSTSMIGAGTQQATVTGNFLQVSGIRLTGVATNWTSSNPNVLSVNSSGLITALNGGSATVSATVDGVTATSASITVATTPPDPTQKPVSLTLALGDTATFSVQALGGNLNYQWKFGATPIAGATNTTLVLTNVSFANAGTYTVSVTNNLGSTNLSATLTVYQAILQHRYSFVSDASDSVGGSNGTVVAPNGGSPATISGGLNLPGGGGPGFSGYVTLPAGILNTTANLTVECWATQNTANTWAEIFNFNNGQSQYLGFIPNPGNNNGNMSAAFRNGNEDDAFSGDQFPSGAEQYVAVTFNANSLVGSLYTNGTLIASVTCANSSYIPGTYNTANNYLGQDPFPDQQFQGTIYEFRIWDGVVSPLYQALSAAAGPSVVVSNLTPTSVSVTVTNSSMIQGQTQTASVVGNFVAVSGVTVTSFATNWISSNPGVLTVTSNGLVTAVSTGSATISATVNGVTGTSASISVPTSGPIITQDLPASETLLVGATLNLRLGNIGTPPFTYYLYTNSSPVPLSISSSPMLMVTNLQLAASANYTVVVSNRYGTATSATLALTVTAPTTYEQAILALNPVGYWPLNETSGNIAYDVVGGYNGTYTTTSVNGSTYALGQTGPPESFFGGSSYAAYLQSAYVDIPGAPFNITGPLTAVAWVQLIVTPTFDTLVGKGDTSWRISINPSSEPGANDGAPPADATSPTGINDNNWHMVVYTYTGNTNQANNGSLYVDGALVANNTVGVTPAGNNLDVWIGGAPDYGTARLLPGANVAQVAVFNQALTAAQVQGLTNGVYVLGPQTISIARSGKNVTLNWQTGTLLQATNLLGPWITNSAAVAPYTVPATNATEFFKLLVTP